MLTLKVESILDDTDQAEVADGGFLVHKSVSTRVKVFGSCSYSIVKIIQTFKNINMKSLRQRGA